MINFTNSYNQLPNEFYSNEIPSAAVRPHLIAFNDKLASELGLDCSSINNEKLALIFSGKELLEKGSYISMAYAGHQFGHFVPSLGDGRAILMGEVTDYEGLLYDIHLKGAGRTNFSRRGDGRSSLGPVLREYIVSEAMYHLGVPTTRALAAVLTGDDVFREDIFPGGVFTRVARGHIRVGTFEYFFSREEHHNVKVLSDYAIARFDKDLVDLEDKYNKFFERIVKRKLNLVAKWMGLGFIHGVMNTDNTSISGETIDYGPCAFMDKFSFDKVFSSIDRHGRYRYANQGNIALWNLSVLANTLFPLLKREGETDEDAIQRLQQKFKEYSAYYETQWLRVMGNKIGIFDPLPSDSDLINDFLSTMENHGLDFTNTFRNLHNFDFVDEEISSRWHQRLKEQGKDFAQVRKLMDSVNPFVIPRNHQIEKAINDAIDGNFEHFHFLRNAFENPYKEDSDLLTLTVEPLAGEIVTKTFCGT